MDFRHHESIIDKVKHVFVIAILCVAVAAFLPLVVLLIQGNGFSDLLIPLLVGTGVFVISIIVLVFANSRAVEPLHQDLVNLKSSAAAAATGNFTAERTVRHDEFVQIEEDILKLSKGLRQIIAQSKELGHGKPLDNRIFPGELKDMASGLTNLINGYENKERTAKDSLKTAMNTLNTDIKTASGNLNSNRRSQRLNTGSYPVEWRDVAENLRKYIDDTDNIISDKNDKLSQLKKQVDELNKQVTNLTQTVNERKTQASYATSPTVEGINQRLTNSTTTFQAGGKVGISAKTRPLDATITSTAQRPRPTAPAIKSTKVTAPSGAHEYDRKDFGKY